MADHPSNPPTVKFNVGGRHFETAHSLINREEDTMLARLVSDTWLEDPTKPVFIDRDGDLFAHVLNYLRYGSITLPASIPKDMFIRDLDFYGIVPEEGTVKALEGWAGQVASRHERIESLESEKGGLELENGIDLLAGYCFNSHLRSNVFGRTLTIEASEEYELYQTARVASNPTPSRSLFESSLSKFGLRLVDIRHYPSSRKYNIDRVKINLGAL